MDDPARAKRLAMGLRTFVSTVGSGLRDATPACVAAVGPDGGAVCSGSPGWWAIDRSSRHLLLMLSEYALKRDRRTVEDVRVPTDEEGGRGGISWRGGSKTKLVVTRLDGDIALILVCDTSVDIDNVDSASAKAFRRLERDIQYCDDVTCGLPFRAPDAARPWSRNPLLCLYVNNDTETFCWIEASPSLSSASADVKWTVLRNAPLNAAGETMHDMWAERNLLLYFVDVVGELRGTDTDGDAPQLRDVQLNLGGKGPTRLVWVTVPQSPAPSGRSDECVYCLVRTSMSEAEAENGARSLLLAARKRMGHS